MGNDSKYMLRCLELAAKGKGNVAPNPMVGSVIVLNDVIIGEGYHMKYGEAHAEVNAVANVTDKSLLSQSTLYVNLEPCSHFGKTPPCASLIVEHKFKRVVIGAHDTNELVAGKGIEKLKSAGIDVTVGVLEKECKELNKRFYTFHEKNRPYIILKWAQTSDGFLDISRNENEQEKRLKITNEHSNALSHSWRSEEQAIMVGKNTAILDNPMLTVRNTSGKNPLRIATDRNLTIPNNYALLDKSTPTVIFTSADAVSEKNLEYIKIDFDEAIIPQMMRKLVEKNIQSLIVEGGTHLLDSFIAAEIWDEARVFIADKKIGDGVNAPSLKEKPMSKEDVNGDVLLRYKNEN